jgi:hypothetical protein
VQLLSFYLSYKLKFSILILLFLLSSRPLFAQSKATDSVVKIFLKQFNSKKFESIYNAFSANYKSKVSKTSMELYLMQIHQRISHVVPLPEGFVNT